MENNPLHRRFFNYHATNGTIGKMSQDYILVELKNLIELKELLASGQGIEEEILEEETEPEQDYYLDTNSIVSITERTHKRKAIVETAIFDKKYPINLLGFSVYGDTGYVKYMTTNIENGGFPLMSNQQGDIRTRFHNELRDMKESYLTLLRNHTTFTEERNFGELRFLINEPLYVSNYLQRRDISHGYINNSEHLYLQSQFGGKRNVRHKLKTTFNEITPNTMLYTPVSYSFRGGRSILAKFYTQTESMVRVYNTVAVPNIYGNTRLCLGTTTFTRSPSNLNEIQKSIHDFFGGVFNSDLSIIELPIVQFLDFIKQAKMNFLDQEMLGTIPENIQPYKTDILNFLDDYQNFLETIADSFKDEYASKREEFIANHTQHYAHFGRVNISQVEDFYDSLSSGVYEPIFQNSYMLLLISNITSTPLDIIYMGNPTIKELIKKGLFIYNNGEYVLR